MNNQSSLIPLTGLSFAVGLLVLSSSSPVATQAKRFTVQINGENTGSGTIIEREKDSYTVLTSWHVVKHPGEYSVTTFDNKKHKIVEIKNLPDIDLALVKFRGRSKRNKTYQVAELGDSKNVTSGLPIYLSGFLNPQGKKPKRSYLLQPAQTLSLQSLAEEGYRIVHDHSLIPGTSGGAIVDRQARMVGINGIRTKEANNELGLGLGIPIQIYQASQDKFISIGSHGKKKQQQEQSDNELTKEKPTLIAKTDSSENKLTNKYHQVYTSPAGHFGDVNTIAMSGNIIVTGSEDKTIKVWNRTSRKPPITLVGHTAPVTKVLITNNNIISSSQDSTIRFWDLTTGQTQRILKDHTSTVESIAVSNNGKILVSGSGDGSLKVWDLQDDNADQPIETITRHSAPVYSVAISANNQIIVSASVDKTIKTWDLSSEKSPQTLVDKRLSRQLTRQAIKKLAKSKKKKANTQKPNIQISHNASVDSLIISKKDGSNKELIISGGSDNLIKVWNLETGELQRVLRGHNNSIRDLAISGNILVSADSHYETIKVWNVSNGDLKRSFDSNHYFWFSSIAISEDGSTLVSASQDEAIKIRDIENGRLERIKDPHTGKKENILIANSNSVRAVTISDNHIFNASRNNTITVRNLETGELEHLLRGHTKEVNSLAVNGNILVSGSQDRTIRIWNLENWELTKTIRNFLDPITRSIAISKDGQKLVTGSYHTIKIWDLRTGKLEKFLDSHRDGVNAIAVKDNTIVSGGGDKKIEVRSLATGELQYSLPLAEDRNQGHKAAINSIVISEDKIFSASYDKTIKVWDLATGKWQETLTDHQAAVNSLAISDNILVSGSRDGAIETRNLETGKLEDIIEAHPTSVNTVAISGNTIVSGSSDNTIKIWRINSDSNEAVNLETNINNPSQNN